MPYTDDKIYGPIKIEEVVIAGKNMKRQRYLDLSGELYYHNARLFREAIRYMHQIGDKKAEQQIFMKRVRYSSNQAAKGVFAGMSLTVGAVAAVGYGTVVAAHPLAQAIAAKTYEFARPAWKFYKATTYWRMGINATTQTLLNDEGFYGIDYISVASEGVGFGVGFMTNMVELRPLSEEQNIFRLVGYNKSISETAFDMSLYAIIGGSQSSISKGVRNQFNGLPSTTMLIDRLFSPVVQLPWHYTTQSLSKDIKSSIFLENK